MSLRVRELPPLRLMTLVTTPSGRRYRWAIDEPRPENISSQPQFGDTAPGGEDQSSQTLARKSGVDYSDLERLSSIQHYGPGGEFVAGYRLERAPRTSGDQMAIEPSAVGHQAALEDDKSATVVFVDQDLGAWGEPSSTRKAALNAVNLPPSGSAESTPDKTTDQPALRMHVDGTWASPEIPCAETLYDAGAGAEVAQVYYDFVGDPTYVSTAWQLFLIQFAQDDGTAEVDSGDLFGAMSGSGYFPFSNPSRCVSWNWRFNATPAGTDNAEHAVDIRKLTLYGPGVVPRGDAPGGVYASDVIPEVLDNWAPTLSYSEGTDGSIQASDFAIPQLAFREPTTAAEIIKQANRFHLRPWAVWDSPSGPIFYYQDWGERGRWRARIGPTQLSETGPSVERLWNSIMVRFRDTDGSTKTVGPPGSGADLETTELRDDDELNPANQAGITRRDLLDMGIVSTSEGGIETGVRFLEQSKLLDSSGSATITGYCEDEHGIKRPYWQLRSGDEISFVDAADTSYRRIVRTQKDHGNRTCSIDLDAPPEGLDALLERLGVVLVPLGIG